ncbi:response regulator [Granulicella sibirica]|uniref:Response regulatory domain-containing protein n=1 Tax=Granulicella sibirica TaxID=2479048 RepID=A0A4Q0SXM7_9BACT|nr:response regulator [Granulicella sibirica]RXH55903.1 hypothetical protein GRAN_2760 [Granulicella sibirica]
MAHERILVVDDEPSVRSIVAALLERSGYRVFVAASAQEALNLLLHEQGSMTSMS